MSYRAWVVVFAAACGAVGCGQVSGDAEGTTLAVSLDAQSRGNGRGHRKKDWPMSQYDASGSGHNDRENKLKRSNVDELEVKWTFDAADAGEPVSSVHANPVVAGGKTYVGTMTGQFFAIDEDGNMMWKFNTFPGSPLIAAVLGNELSPVVSGALLPEHENTVVLGDGDGKLYKLDRDDGTLLWHVDLDDNDLGGFWGNSLTIVGDTIYAGIGSFEPLAPLFVPSRTCCTHRGAVVAIDLETGNTKWRWEAVTQSEQGPFPPELIAQLGGVETFGPSGGDVWSQPTYDEETSTVFAGTGQLFSRRPDGTGTGTFDAIVALNAKTGAVRWIRQFSDNLDVFRFDIPFFDPSTGLYVDKDFGDHPKVYKLGNGRKVVAAGQKSGDFHVVDAETGEVVRSTHHITMITSEGGFQTGGANDGERNYAHGGDTATVSGMPFDGVVMALDKKGDDVLWQLNVPGSALYGSLAVANGVVYFQSPYEDEDTGVPTWALYAVHSGTGEVLNRFLFPNQRALNGPAIAEGRIYAGFGGLFGFGPATPTLEGGVVCLGLE